MRVPGADGRADKRFALPGRYSSAIRTGCANERPSGSVRGAPGNWCPYRDRQPSSHARDACYTWPDDSSSKPRGFWDYALLALAMTGVLMFLFWLDASDG